MSTIYINIQYNIYINTSTIFSGHKLNECSSNIIIFPLGEDASFVLEETLPLFKSNVLLSLDKSGDRISLALEVATC